MPTIRFEEVHPYVETHRDNFLKSLRVDPARWREDQEFELQSAEILKQAVIERYHRSAMGDMVNPTGSFVVGPEGGHALDGIVSKEQPPVIFNMLFEVPASLRKTTQWVARITLEAGSWRFMVGDHVWAVFRPEPNDGDPNKIRSTIEKLPENLTSLLLSHCKSLTDVSCLAGFKNLTNLNLYSCEFLMDVSGLAGLKNLTSLDLGGCSLRTGVSALGELKNLTSLNLRSCESLTDVSVLAGLKNLTNLTLNSCKSLTGVNGLEGLKSLTHLDLGGCESLTDVSALGELKNLTSLELGGCDNLTDVSALGELKNLTSLQLGGCDNLTDVSVLAGFKNLTKLNLSFCESLTDLSGLEGLKKLTYLELGLCESLTDLSGLEGLKKLTHLELWSCEGIRKLDPLSSLRHLQSLDIRGSLRINSVAPLREIPSLGQLIGFDPDQTNELLAHTAVLRCDTVYIDACAKRWCAELLLMNEAALEEWEQFATTLGEALSLLGESPHEESYEDCLRGKPEISADPWKAWFSGTREVSGWELMRSRVERQELTKATPGFVGGVCASLAGEGADKDEQDWARGWLGKMEEAWSERGKELVSVAAEICVGLLRCNMAEDQKNWLERFTDDSDPALLDPVQAALGNWQLEQNQIDEAHEHANAIETVALRDPLLVKLAKRYVSVRPARAGEILLTIDSAQLRKELMETLTGEPDFVAEPANVECLVVACEDSAESLAKLIEILPAGTDHTLMEELSLCARKKTKDFSALRRRCLERLLEECS